MSARVQRPAIPPRAAAAAHPSRDPGPGRLSRLVAIAIAAFAVGIVLVAVPMSLVLMPQFGATGPVFVLVFPELVLSLTLVGAFVALRVPDNPVGWLLAGTGLALAVGIFGGTYVIYDHDLAGGTLPLVVPIAWLSSWLTVPAIGTLGVYVPMLFPTGRFLSRRWRALALVSLVPFTLAAAASALAPGPLASTPWIENPAGIPAAGSLLAMASTIGNVPAPFLFGAAIVSVVLRYRRGAALERHQLKWFGYVAAIAIVALVVSLLGAGPVSDGAWLVACAALAAYPVAIGMAILRYHLYDIDRIISRTLAYAVVTALLGLLFAGIALGSQELLASVVAGNGVAVAVSTLAVAASFQPLRRRVQRAVDRRFDRARYDADRVVGTFSDRLRGEVELDALVAGVGDAARGSMGPASASVWLRQAGSGRG